MIDELPELTAIECVRDLWGRGRFGMEIPHRGAESVNYSRRAVKRLQVLLFVAEHCDDKQQLRVFLKEVLCFRSKMMSAGQAAMFAKLILVDELKAKYRLSLLKSLNDILAGKLEEILRLHPEEEAGDLPKSGDTVPAWDEVLVLQTDTKVEDLNPGDLVATLDIYMVKHCLVADRIECTNIAGVDECIKKLPSCYSKTGEGSQCVAKVLKGVYKHVVGQPLFSQTV